MAGGDFTEERAPPNVPSGRRAGRRSFPRVERTIRLFFGGLIVVGGILLIRRASTIEFLSLPVPWVGPIDKGWLYVVGVALVPVGLVLGALSARYSLAAAIVVYSVLLVLMIAHQRSASGDVVLVRPAVPQQATLVRRVTMGEDHWFEEYSQFDSRFGSIGIPNAVRRYHHPDFDVLFSFDEEGWRQMPAATPVERSSGEIWFLGCSFTFGFGVQDDETYPAVLAKEAWTSYRIRNLAQAGWGTTNAYLVLSDRLKRGVRPVCVFYGWIGHHAERNDALSEYNLKTSKMPHPYFEIEDGRPVFRRIIEPGRDAPPSGDPIDEKRLTLLLLREMSRLCREAGVPFFVLAFDTTDDVLESLRGSGEAEILPVTTLVSTKRFPRDGHPTRHWHREIAGLLAGWPKISDRTGRADLMAPSGVVAAPKHWWVSDQNMNGITCVLRPPDSPGNSFRVKQIHTKPGDPYRIGVHRVGFAIEDGREYTLRFRGRAERARPILVSVQLEFEPTVNAGLSQGIALGTHWESCECVFRGLRSNPHGSLSIYLADSDASFELRDVQLLDGGRDLLKE